MNNKVLNLFLLVLTVILSSCTPTVDLEKEKQALLQVHETDRRAHFNTNPDLIMEHAASEFIMVHDGAIDTIVQDQMKSMFSESFKGATYYEWDDLNPPIIKISNDATMAWMIVRVKVRRTQMDSTGQAQERKFIYGGIMTYEKLNGKWARNANVSTFQR